MKVGLVLDDTLDTPDGVQQYVLQLGKWLKSQKHEVHYLVGNTTRTDIANIHSLSRNVHVRFNGNRMSMPLPTSRRKLRRFLLREQFDILHVQVPYSPFMAGRLLRAVPPMTAVIGTFHILPHSRLASLANRLLSLMNKRSGKRFDRMLAVSKPAAAFAAQMYGYQPTVIPNPILLAQFADARSESPTLNIVFLGRLVARKGVMLLLQAVTHLREQKFYSEAFRVIIGGKGQLLPQLERFVNEHNLHDVVSFQGFIKEADKGAFLAQADIAVYPSTGGESFGIVLLEAMAAARGVVLAGNNPGYAAVLGPFPDQLFSPKDIPVFAGKLADYLKDTKARQMAAKAQRTYVQQFDINIVGAQIIKIYSNALQSRRQT